VGKLAVKTGMWILWERDHGKLKISSPSRAAVKKPAPLASYLSAQGRFKGIDPAVAERLQAEVLRTIERFVCEEGQPCAP
jgi:pyruvate ferredoxin oxidoreductase beta subunit